MTPATPKLEPITSIASLKRVLATPGIVVIRDRDTGLENERTLRTRESIDALAAPRRVKAVRSNDVQLLRHGTEDQIIYMEIPNASNIRFTGDNRFAFIHKESDQTTGREMHYRVEIEGTAYPASQLPTTLKAATDQDIENARKAAEEHENATKIRASATREARAALSSLPPPTAQPGWAELETAMMKSVEAITDAGPISNDELADHVAAATADLETWQFLLEPTPARIDPDESPVAPYLRVDHLAYHWASRPRGHVLPIIEVYKDGSEHLHEALISTGGPKPAFKYKIYGKAEITDADAFRRLMESTCYDLRRLAEKNRRDRQDANIVASTGLRENETITNIRISGKTYRSAVITAIKGNTAHLNLSTGQKRYTATMNIADLSRIVSAAGPKHRKPPETPAPAPADTLI